MASSPSTYIADALHARLVIDGFLVDGARAKDGDKPGETFSEEIAVPADECPHRKTTYNGIFRICDACKVIVHR